MADKHPCHTDNWANWMRQTLYGALVASGVDNPNTDDINRFIRQKRDELKAVRDNHIGEGDIFGPLVSAVIREACDIMNHEPTDKEEPRP